MRRYEFRSTGLRVRLVDPAIEGGVGIRVEHDSGAALIVASVFGEETEDGLQLEVVGFDGTRFDFSIDAHWRTITMRASVATPIFGGETSASALRVQEKEETSGKVRVTGTETTMPIDVGES
jgi:hypothetical protein